MQRCVTGHGHQCGYGKQGGESGQQTIGDLKNPETDTKYLISIEVNEKTKPINIYRTDVPFTQKT